MLQPPPLKDLPRYPVTASIGLAAIAATLAWWTHWSGWDMPEILGTSFHELTALAHGALGCQGSAMIEQ